jgi:hypothetical protein
MLEGANTLNDIKQAFDPDSMHTDILDLMKQVGFYTDAYGEAEWSEPHNVVDENMARRLLAIARILLPKRETTEREMELWGKHLSEHWGKPDMEKRMLLLEEALQQEGLRNMPMEQIRAFYGFPDESRH